MSKHDPVNEGSSKRERILSAIVDNVDAVIFAMDREATFTLSRGRGLVRLGLEPDQVVGVSGRVMYADYPEILAGIDSALEGRPTRVVERVGDTVFDISFAPDMDAGGRIVGLVGIGYDITELVGVAEELERVNQSLQEATRAKSAFLAAMSHELRTPLNSIIGFSGMIMQEFAGPLTAEQRTQIGMVQKSGAYLLSLIENLLDLSRIEAGGVELRPEEFDPVDVILEVADMVAPLAEDKGLKLEVEVPEDGATLLSDRVRVKQILLNLVANAVKFTHEGRVGVRLQDGPEGACEVSVTDTGPGISPEYLSGIFEPFVQMEHARHRAKPAGIGLGLTICREFAAHLGGEILVTSEVGRGSEFLMRVPPLRPSTSRSVT